MGLPTPYWERDGLTIYCGEALDILRQLPSASVDAVVTDPPYSSGGMFRSDRQAEPTAKYTGWSHTEGETFKPAATYGTFAGDNRDQRGWMAWVAAWSFQSLRITRAAGSVFTFSDWRQVPAASDAIQMGGWVWRALLVWDKGVGRPVKGRFRNHLEFILWGTNGPTGENGDEYPSAMIQVPTVHASEREHVTQKPAELMSHLLRVVPNAETIVDPFMGVGSTLVAARDLGRRAIGVEVDERNCEIAVRRLSQQLLPFEGA